MEGSNTPQPPSYDMNSYRKATDSYPPAKPGTYKIQVNDDQYWLSQGNDTLLTSYGPDQGDFATPWFIKVAPVWIVLFTISVDLLGTWLTKGSLDFSDPEVFEVLIGGAVGSFFFAILVSIFILFKFFPHLAITHRITDYQQSLGYFDIKVGTSTTSSNGQVESVKSISYDIFKFNLNTMKKEVWLKFKLKDVEKGLEMEKSIIKAEFSTDSDYEFIRSSPEPWKGLYDLEIRERGKTIATLTNGDNGYDMTVNENNLNLPGLFAFVIILDSVLKPS